MRSAKLCVGSNGSKRKSATRWPHSACIGGNGSCLNQAPWGDASALQLLIARVDGVIRLEFAGGNAAKTSRAHNFGNPVVDKASKQVSDAVAIIVAKVSETVAETAHTTLAKIED